MYEFTMPEDNQFQSGLQPMHQPNSQIKQDNFVQELQVQEVSQQTVQENNTKSVQQDLQSITEQKTQTIYYHPSWMTKILSGIFRFLGISLIRAGLWNFSLIGTQYVSLSRILYVGGIITLCGVFYILVGRLLYCTKKWIHFGISLLCTLAANIMFTWILQSFTRYNFDIYYISELFGIVISFLTLIYFVILTIVWLIKCYRFNKKGITNKKYLNTVSSKKTVGYITAGILLLVVIVDFIYGKIQWSKIPEVDESIFYREEHQIKLPDEKDALVQLRNYYETFWNNNELRRNIESFYFSEWRDEELLRKQHIEECIPVYSGGNSYCGTWIWSRKTLNRLLNRYYDKNWENVEKEADYLKIDGKKIKIIEYLNKNEHEIRNNLLELDHILSLDYYIPNDEYLGILPFIHQPFARASSVILQYYILKNDWDMVMLIININYKMIDITNHVGGIQNNVISFVVQGLINYTINSSIKIFPEDIRFEIINLIQDDQYRNSIVRESAKGEYVAFNEAIKVSLMEDVGVNKPSLIQFMFHFPFYSFMDTKHAMLYIYSMIYNEQYDDSFKFERNILGKPLSLYNYLGKQICNILHPYTDLLYTRLNNNILKRKALITNLEAGDYKARYEEPDRKTDSSYYEQNLITSIRN